MAKKICLVLLLVMLFVPIVLWGQELSQFAGRGKVGTTGLQFLKIGVSARAIALGEAFTALANDASAIYYNPAGLTQLSGRQLFLNHTEWVADIRYEFIGFVLPTSMLGTFGVHAALLSTGDMKRTLPYVGWTGEYFNASDWLIGLTYSRMLTNKFSIGGNVKFIVEHLDNQHVQNWAVDFGTLFDIGVRGIKFGMCINNFGPNAKYLSEEFSMPVNFKFGFVFNVAQWGSHNIVSTIEGCHPNDNVEQLAWGMEYNLSDWISLRMGYRYFLKLDELDKVVKFTEVRSLDVDEPLEGFSFGAGINVPIGVTKTRIDYSYSDMSFLDNAQRFSLIFQF